MGVQDHLLVRFIVIIASLSLLVKAKGHFSTEVSSLKRSSFPKNFLWGAATSAYQIEGGANYSGPSIWHTFTHKYPEKIKDNSNGDVACDSYHRFKEDVQICKNISLNAYRFSISWARVIPSGKLSDGVSEEGIAYYNNLINEVIQNGLVPFVTLFHFDLPQALEDEYGGFRSNKIVRDFHDFADLCFKKFGDRVKHWTTLNEPWSFSMGGYVYGSLAPGRCSSWLKLNCTGGDSGTEPYLVAHNQLLAHGNVVKLYRRKYQKLQKGEIGITLVSTWIMPLTNTPRDNAAAQRGLDFMFGWFMDPITIGHYPRSMQQLVGSRLPKFSKKQSKSLIGSFDFLGINCYTSQYAGYANHTNLLGSSYATDSQINLTYVKNGVPIGKMPGSAWLYVYPKGIADLLIYIKNKYDSPRIFITETGVDQLDTSEHPLTIEKALNDGVRIQYYRQHLRYVQHAIKEGVNVEGFFAWSLIDNFEWASGYTSRFGITYINRTTLARIPKRSAYWLKNFLSHHA